MIWLKECNWHPLNFVAWIHLQKKSRNRPELRHLPFQKMVEGNLDFFGVPGCWDELYEWNHVNATHACLDLLQLEPQSACNLGFSLIICFNESTKLQNSARSVSFSPKYWLIHGFHLDLLPTSLYWLLSSQWQLQPQNEIGALPLAPFYFPTWAEFFLPTISTECLGLFGHANAPCVSEGMTPFPSSVALSSSTSLTLPV